MHRAFGALRGWRRIQVDPRANGCHQAIPQPRNRCDVDGPFWVVAEKASQRGDGLIDRIRRDDDAGPNVFE